MASKCARGEQTALLPELPPELWNKITKPLTTNVPGCSRVRLLNKRFAEEYEWELLRAGIKAQLAFRKRQLEEKRARADERLAATSSHRLANVSTLQGELCGEGRLELFLMVMVREFMPYISGAHPMRLALTALRETRSA
jgi:hypothetical protein